jgi:hypothetical protein
MRENEKLVTVAKFENGFDAELAKIVLEREGIDSVIVGLDAAVSLYFTGIVHIELQVFSGDAARAVELLAKASQSADSTDNI